MKITIVSSYYPPHLGGLEIVAHYQAKLLAATGNVVTVITSKTDSDRSHYVEDGVEVVRIPALNISERWGAPFPIFSPSLLWALSRSIKHADIVHVHDAFYMSSFFAALCARWYKKPLVLTQHVAMIAHPSKAVMAIQKIVYATSGNVIFRISTIVIAFNDRVKEFLLAQGVPERKIMALYNGVDSELFHPVSIEEKDALRAKLGLSTTKKIILFVGRFVPKKGFSKVLAARSKEYQIVFAGGDAPSESNEEVVFLGKLSQSMLAEVYQAADIFVLPSEGEGFPLSVQEAMATGLPIITSDDYGYGRYNFDREKMVFIDKPTETSVREAIKELLDNDARLSAMSSYSEEYALTHFKWSFVISQLEKIYTNLAL
jgi:D-inositol-3-phosphate glycosyltransferase